MKLRTQGVWQNAHKFIRQLAHYIRSYYIMYYSWENSHQPGYKVGPGQQQQQYQR